MQHNFTYLKGIKTYAFNTRDELIDFAVERKSILIAITARKIMTADRIMIDLINNNIGYTDGFGAVWALRKHGFKNVIKIPGCELWLDIIRKFYKKKSFYLVGSIKDVIESTVKNLIIDFPGINILNYRDGYIKSQNEEDELITDIMNKKPDIVFVAAGYPMQEILMNKMLAKHQALYMGLGGSFDVYTNIVKRAPKIFRKTNLEWFYRLIKQPIRIHRQIHLIRFAYLNIIGRI